MNLVELDLACRSILQVLLGASGLIMIVSRGDKMTRNTKPSVRWSYDSLFFIAAFLIVEPLFYGTASKWLSLLGFGAAFTLSALRKNDWANGVPEDFLLPENRQSKTLEC